MRWPVRRKPDGMASFPSDRPLSVVLPPPPAGALPTLCDRLYFVPLLAGCWLVLKPRRHDPVMTKPPNPCPGPVFLHTPTNQPTHQLTPIIQPKLPSVCPAQGLLDGVRAGWTRCSRCCALVGPAAWRGHRDLRRRLPWYLTPSGPPPPARPHLCNVNPLRGLTRGLF